MPQFPGEKMKSIRHEGAGVQSIKGFHLSVGYTCVKEYAFFKDL